jgi:phenylacetate-CoA ligase
MKKIDTLINSAYNTVPAYNHLYNDHNIFEERDTISFETDFSRLPVISKDTIRKFGIENFINQNFFEELSNKKDLHRFTIEHTSGTTGMQMQIFWHNLEFCRSTYEHWILRKTFGNIYPTSRCCTVLYDDIDDFFVINGHKLLLNRRKTTYNSAVRFLRLCEKFDPEWIYMPGSVIVYLIFVAQREHIPFGKNVRYIEAATEPLIPIYRAIIEHYFNIKIHNMYGCQETNGIAFECACGHLHIMQNNVHVEILNENGIACQAGEWGNVCVTSLHNTLMPFIRYKLNDIAMFSDFECPCGNKSPIIELNGCRFPEIMLFNNHCLFPEGELFYPVRRFSFMSFENEAMFSLQLISPRKYKISFRNIKEDELQEYSDLFLEIMKAYGLENLLFEFEIEKEVINTYRVGVIKKI